MSYWCCIELLKTTIFSCLSSQEQRCASRSETIKYSLRWWGKSSQINVDRSDLFCKCFILKTEALKLLYFSVRLKISVRWSEYNQNSRFWVCQANSPRQRHVGHTELHQVIRRPWSHFTPTVRCILRYLVTRWVLRVWSISFAGQLCGHNCKS